MANTHNNTDFQFLETDDTSLEEEYNNKYWPVCIIDDDHDVHFVTKLVLSNVEFSGRKLQFISAYSEKEARKILAETPSIALILLDVVMEHEDSGLRLIKYIREELENKLVRIILRTGQPGQAPEKDVILSYDINDYKAKIELTKEKLYTSIITGIRSYRDLLAIDKSRYGLERIIDATSSIFELKTLRNFVETILTQLVSILRYNIDSPNNNVSGFTASKYEENTCILSSTGKYQDIPSIQEIDTIVSNRVVELIERAFEEKRNIFDSNRYVIYVHTQAQTENIIYLEREEPLDKWERHLIDIFCTNISTAFDNLYLKEKLEKLVHERTTQLQQVNHELNIKNITFERELNMARSVQQSILPKVFTNNDFFSVYGQYFPKQNLGGDYYDIFQFNERKLAFTIVDVSGHGVSAALITTMAKMSFANTAREYNPPYYILNQINDIMCNSISSSGMFLTAFYGIIDLEKGTLHYANGGHNPVIIKRKNGELESSKCLNTIIGMFAEEDYISEEIPIFPGDTIVCYTDGIVESKDDANNFFGLQTLENIIRESDKTDPQQLSAKILDDVRNHIGKEIYPDDDLSVLVIHIKEEYV